MRAVYVGAIAALFATSAAPPPAAAQAGAGRAPGYHLVKRIPLGGEGGWDYLAVDPAAHRLYISRSTHVIVLDIDRDTVVGDIPNTPGVHGIALAPGLGRGFVSDGRDSTVTIFDLKTLAVLGTVKVTGRNPDAIVYDPSSRRVFTFNGGSDNSTAIDGRTGKVVGTIDLGGRPEFATADGAGHIYVNIEDKSQVVAFGSKTLAIQHRWPLAPCESPSGMAIDPLHHRLFSGCHNKVMAVMNAETGQVVATPPIGQGVDADRYDPGTHLAFASCGDGTLAVVHEDSPNKFTVVETDSTERGARTMALDESTHRVYLVTARFGPRPAPTPANPRPFPTIVPGSFVVLVYAPQR